MCYFDLEYYKSTKKFILDLAKCIDYEQIPVFLCVGSDKVIADSLGPLVGDMLINKYQIPAYVYGHFGRTVNGKNLEEFIGYIKLNHKGKIFVIDSSEGEIVKLGKVSLSDSPAIMRRSNPIACGDYSILGHTIVTGVDGLMMLKCVSIKLVINLANRLASAISEAIRISLSVKIAQF